MWFADIATTGVYAMHTDNFGQPDSDISVSTVTTPGGPWTIGGTMWVVETGSTGSKRLLAYNVGTGDREVSNDVRLDFSVSDPWSI